MMNLCHAVGGGLRADVWLKGFGLRCAILVAASGQLDMGGHVSTPRVGAGTEALARQIPADHRMIQRPTVRRCRVDAPSIRVLRSHVACNARWQAPQQVVAAWCGAETQKRRDSPPNQPVSREVGGELNRAHHEQCPAAHRAKALGSLEATS